MRKGGLGDEGMILEGIGNIGRNKAVEQVMDEKLCGSSIYLDMRCGAMRLCRVGAPAQHPTTGPAISPGTNAV